MKNIHILFTGIGRRVELMQSYRQAALVLDINLKLYGADMTGTAPALAYCDYKRKVCGMNEPYYIQQLVDICINDNIDLIIPTIDTDLLILSQNKEAFEKIGTKVLISRPNEILICRDKNNTGIFFESCELIAPKTYNNYKKYDGLFPCFIKPKDGSSSINAYIVKDKEDLAVYANRINDYIIQPYIDGKEYTVDIFCDFEGNPIYITPRERIQVRAGEVLKTRISMDKTIISESKKIIKAFKPCGPITVQLIQDKDTHQNYYIEINPRYGGGAPLSMKAGAKSADAILRLLCGEKLSYQEDSICNGAVYSRFDQSICISSGNDKKNIKGIIFDLDDTLYSEKQYIRSGYKKIADYLKRTEAEFKLWNYFVEGKAAIDTYLNEVDINEKKSECLEIYRNHKPSIKLYDGVIELINYLKEKSIKVGIITDGRIQGQKNKIEMLGLDKMINDIIITDELGGIQFRKPNDISFRIMQNRWKIPFEQIIYVGDNPKKDFQAPHQLGMRSCWFVNKDGLYFEGKQEIEFDYIINNINEIIQLRF